MNLEAFRREAERHGGLRAFANGMVRRAQRLGYARVFKCIVLQEVNPRFLTSDPRYTWERIAPDRLRALSADPVNELDTPFLDVALAKGDECFGFFDGEVLASYGWYSGKPTEMDAPGFAFRFDPRFIYMYKGYTHRDHRGQRLHAVGMTLALQSFLERGFLGLVSTVEWQNSDSLKPCYRLGYRDFGKLYGVRMFGRYYFRSGRGCERYQFRVGRLNPPQPAAG